LPSGFPGGRAAVESPRARIAIVLAPFVAVAVLVAHADGLQRSLAAVGQGQAVVGVTGLLAVAVTVSLMGSLESRHRRARRFLTWTPSTWLVVALALAKVVLLALLYLGVFGDALGGSDLWHPRLGVPLTWVHAALVASLALWLAMRCVRRPLADRDLGGRTLVLALAPAVPFFGLLLGLFVVTAADVFDPRLNPTWGLDVGSWTLENLDNIWLAAALVLLVVPVGERLLRHPLSTGSALWLLAGVWLVPPQLGQWFLTRGHDVPTFWSAPGQVDAALTVGVLVLLARRRPGELRILLRALVVPAALLLGGSLLPGAWTERLWLVLLLASVAGSLLLRAPAVSADRERYEREVLVLVAANVPAPVRLPDGADGRGAGREPRARQHPRAAVGGRPRRMHPPRRRCAGTHGRAPHDATVEASAAGPARQTLLTAPTERTLHAAAYSGLS
jgi:hypothetical protein